MFEIDLVTAEHNLLCNNVLTTHFKENVTRNFLHGFLS